MAKQLFSNNATALMSGTLSAGGTALTLATGDGARFPVPTGGDWFEITVYKKDLSGVWLDIETMKVTARVGDTLTIATRDYDGNIGDPAGIAHDGVADVVYVETLWTAQSAESLQDYADSALAAHTAASDPHTQYLTDAAAAAAFQPLSSNLTSFATTTPTAAGLALLDDADAATQRSTLGLGNVNNTSDANKPVSSAQQSALGLKAPLANPTFTGTVSGVTKAMVGLGNADNTSDANKPVSSAQQSALDLKANAANPSFTGTASFAGTADHNNQNITEIKTASFNSQPALTTTTGAVTVDWSAAQNYKQNEPTGNITYTFTAPVGPCHLQLLIDSDGTTVSRTFTWPGTVIWYGAQWTHTANKKAIINFWYDGSSYHAMGASQA